MHRIGQRDAVNIHFLVAPGTLDDSMWGTISRKVSIVSETLNGVRDSLEADRSTAAEQLGEWSRNITLVTEYIGERRGERRREKEEPDVRLLGNGILTASGRCPAIREYSRPIQCERRQVQLQRRHCRRCCCCWRRGRAFESYSRERRLSRNTADCQRWSGQWPLPRPAQLFWLRGKACANGYNALGLQQVHLSQHANGHQRFERGVGWW